MLALTMALPRSLIIAALITVCLWGVSEARPLLVPLCLSALLAFLLAPLLRFLSRRGISEWASISLAVLLLLLPFAGMAFLLLKQGEAFSRDFPSIMVSIDHALLGFSESFIGKRLHLAPSLNGMALVNRLVNGAGEGLQLILNGLGALVGAGSQLALVLFFSVLMIASRSHLLRCTEQILKAHFVGDTSKMLNAVTGLIERFLVARITIVFIISFVDLGILAAFRLPYSLLMASLLGIMTLVPAIGFIIALVPPVLVSLSVQHSLLSTFALALCLFGMSVVEGNILTPKMVGRRLNINTLATFVGIFAGGLIWGIWGMFLSIPVLGVLRILFATSPALQPWGELIAERAERAERAEPKQPLETLKAIQPVPRQRTRMRPSRTFRPSKTHKTGETPKR